MDTDTGAALAVDVGADVEAMAGAGATAEERIANALEDASSDPHPWESVGRIVRSLHFVPNVDDFDTSWHATQASLLQRMRKHFPSTSKYGRLNLCRARVSICGIGGTAESVLPRVFVSNYAWDDAAVGLLGSAAQQEFGPGVTIDWQPMFPVDSSERARTERDSRVLLRLCDGWPSLADNHHLHRLHSVMRAHLQTALRGCDPEKRSMCAKCVHSTANHSEHRVLILNDDELVAAIQAREIAAHLLDSWPGGAVSSLVLDMASERDVCPFCGIFLAGSVRAPRLIMGMVAQALVDVGFVLSGDFSTSMRTSGYIELPNESRRPGSRDVVMERELRGFAISDQIRGEIMRTWRVPTMVSPIATGEE